MRCPHCRTKTRVTETRGNFRDRTCPTCQRRFQTREIPLASRHRARTLAYRAGEAPHQTKEKP